KEAGPNTGPARGDRVGGNLLEGTRSRVVLRDTTGDSLLLHGADRESRVRSRPEDGSLVAEERGRPSPPGQAAAPLTARTWSRAMPDDTDLPLPPPPPDAAGLTLARVRGLLARGGD